jgi:hypothetical protein
VGWHPKARQLTDATKTSTVPGRPRGAHLGSGCRSRPAVNAVFAVAGTALAIDRLRSFTPTTRPADAHPGPVAPAGQGQAETGGVTSE